MPLNDVRQVENRIMQDSAPSHHAKATQHFLRDNTPNFISSQEWRPHSPDLNPLDYSVWDILHELLYEGRRELFAKLKDGQNVIRYKWHVVNDQTVRKTILQWKRRLAAVARQNGGPIQHIFCWSVDWLMTFWCSLRSAYTSDNINDEPLANIALWCVKLFYLYHS